MKHKDSYMGDAYIEYRSPIDYCIRNRRYYLFSLAVIHIHGMSGWPSHLTYANSLNLNTKPGNCSLIIVGSLLILTIKSIAECPSL